ncbi:MAG: LytR/AlgR family response regulator transcription factor [Sarcina sp.]
MIKVAICDDQVVYSEYISKSIQRICKKENINAAIDIFKSGEEFLEAFRESGYSYNILFSDILMGEITGVELAKQLKELNKSIQIIFVTVSMDYIFDGYDVGALNYILKPINEEKLEEQFLKAVNNIVYKKNKDLFYVNKKSAIKTVDINSIIYFEVNNRIITLVSENEEIEFYDKMDNIEQKLKSYYFVKPHRSYIVNCKYIEEIKKNELILKNGTIIPISRLNIKSIKEKFIDYLENS